MSEIKIKSIIKNFGGNSIAVDNLSETFPDGEFVCLLGPSGCGKTTTLRMIAGLETPDSGEIFYGDKTFFSSKTGEFIKTENRNLGLMFQSYALWPHMTVFKNIVFGLEMQKKSLDEKEKRYLELEKLFHLENFRDRYPSELSGGQQQRVAIARAIINQPALLLADEPTGALDSKTTEDVLNLFDELHQQGITLVLVTHEDDVAARAKRIARFKDGSVINIS